MKVLILYWSLTGNTEAVARAIADTVGESGHDCDLLKIGENVEADWFGYDLVFVGSPVYEFLPPQNVINYLKKRFHYYRDVQGRLSPGSPMLGNKFMVAFCTYAGPHTGLHEAIPAVRYTEQFFEHLGFFILDPIMVVGSFNAEALNGKFGYTKELCEKLNKQGRLGNISGRPNQSDLDEVRNRARGILNFVAAAF
ncbi:MAG: flavodoxin family protein [Candidatus Hadarchaeum sp.]|uniref:flavodoxin family protein n=1 Tax=Candidatus Hadarchaeum sp. TaxID=2883567 RepID=UPI003D137E12